MRVPDLFLAPVDLRNRVADSESQRVKRFLGGVGVGFFYPTSEIQLNYFLKCTPKLGILTRAC